MNFRLMILEGLLQIWHGLKAGSSFFVTIFIICHAFKRCDLFEEDLTQKQSLNKFQISINPLKVN